MFILGRTPPIGCTCLQIATTTASRRQVRTNAFGELGISPKLWRNLKKIGIWKPTDIQRKAIPNMLRGENVVINSETGSGKTLAYALPMLSALAEMKKRRIRIPRPYGLIVVPGTELQYQVCNVFTHVVPGTKVFPASESNLLRLLDTEVVVSTAAHLMTYEVESAFKEVQTVVVDEADLLIASKIGKHGRRDPLFNLLIKLRDPRNFKMFYAGTEEEEEEDVGEECAVQDNCGSSLIRNSSPDILCRETDSSLELRSTEKKIRPPLFKKCRQFVFVGATMPYAQVQNAKLPLNYIRQWHDEINLLQTENTHRALSNVETHSCKVEEENKLKLLLQTLKHYHMEGKFRVLVFVNKKGTATSVHQALSGQHLDDNDTKNIEPDFYVEADMEEELDSFCANWKDKIHVLHSDVHVDDRLKLFQSFASASESIIVSTDVAMRGLDLPDIDLIVQYDFPTNVIDYIHRVGRTARAGNQGTVVNFVAERDEYLAERIESAIDNDESLESLFSRKRGLSRRVSASAYEDVELMEDADFVNYENDDDA